LSVFALAGIVRRIRTAGPATLVAIAAVLLAPWSAHAGEFAINACQADRQNFSTQAFDDFATRGMMWKRACNPEGPGLRGLVTANVVRRGRVASGARSYFVLRAPEGTQFSHLLWSGMARRRDCRYALQLWADRPDGSAVPIKNVRANQGCPHHGRAQAAGWPSPHWYDIGGATRIVQRTVCLGSPQTPYCAANGLNYIRTFTARATVVDVSPPGVSIAQDNAFTRGEWVNGVQSVTYGALDNVGVKVARAVVGNTRAGERPHACDYSRRVPCASERGSIEADTRHLSEGTQPLQVEAEDGAGNTARSAPVTVRVDHVAPGSVPIAVDGGETWRNQNDFGISWTNPVEVDRAPITGVHFRICRTDGSSCQAGGQSGLGLARLDHVAVPGSGEWQLRLWREDAAGNTEPANASVPVSLRFDPEPPQLGFENPSAADPTRLRRGRRENLGPRHRADRAQPRGIVHLAVPVDRTPGRSPGRTNRRRTHGGGHVRPSRDRA
jgi:hypothetical protein